MHKVTKVTKDIQVADYAWTWGKLFLRYDTSACDKATEGWLMHLWPSSDM